MVQKTSRENVTSTVLFFLLFCFLMDVTGGKTRINLEELTKIEKEETHAHRKRATSALSRERTLEL